MESNRLLAELATLAMVLEHMEECSASVRLSTLYQQKLLSYIRLEALYFWSMQLEDNGAIRQQLKWSMWNSVN